MRITSFNAPWQTPAPAAHAPTYNDNGAWLLLLLRDPAAIYSHGVPGDERGRI
jgi:hypothetical protein